MNQLEISSRNVPISVGHSIGGLDALALYDNQSECPEELNFKKGDVLKILEKDFNGMMGWWLCALKDKIGLAPGNRLEVTGTVPEKPQNFQRPEKLDASGKTIYDMPKTSYGVYNVPKMSYDPPKQQQQEKLQEIPDILKGQNINPLNQSRSNNQILYSGPVKTPYQEETKTRNQLKDAGLPANHNGPDAYIWPDDVNLIPNSGKLNLYINSPVTNENFPNAAIYSGYKNSPDSSNAYSISWNNIQRISPPMNVSTYNNLQYSPIPNQNCNVESQQQQYGQLPRGNFDPQHSLNRQKRVIYSDSSDNYDNIQAPPVILVNGQPRSMANEKNNHTFVATTNNNKNNSLSNGKINSNNNGNVQYYNSLNKGQPIGSHTLQHKPRRVSEESRLFVRDDTELQMRRKIEGKGKRDRSLRRVRFADQVTSSDTEEWTRNGDKPHNHNSFPLKPILTLSSNQNKCELSSNNSISCSNTNDNANNIIIMNGIKDSDFSTKPNKQILYQPLQDNMPDYENPYSEIVDQPLYEGPANSYISMNSRLPIENSRVQIEGANKVSRLPGKNYTTEFTAALNNREANNYNNGNSSALGNNSNASNAYSYLQPKQKKLEGVIISPPTYNVPFEDEPEYQLCFVDLTKKEQEKAASSEDVSTKLSPELLNKSREKIQILANSLDGILNRRNAEDATVASVILKSIDVELQFLVDVGGRALRKSVETWSAELIDSLVQHIEDLKTNQGTLVVLNKQVMEVSKNTSNRQNCQTFDTICSSCALSGRNICYPVHQFVDYLLPKFKLLFPINSNDVGRIAPSPTFNANPNKFSTMTKNQLKGKTQEVSQLATSPPNQTHSSLKSMPNIPRLPSTGGTSSPIPKLESLPSYKNNGPKESLYYDDSKLSHTLTKPKRFSDSQVSSSDEVVMNGKVDAKHGSLSQTQDAGINGDNRTNQTLIPPASQVIQSRPLPPAPKPPSYSSVIGQTSYNSLPFNMVRENNQPAVSIQLHPTSFMRTQTTRDSPIYNSNYNGDNTYNYTNNLGNFNN